MADKKCSELVGEQWQSTREDIAAMLMGEGWENYRKAQGYDDDFDGSQAFSEYGLCFDYVQPDTGENGFYRFQMSWGGPSDELRFYADIRGECHVIEYWYMDWFDGAKVTVTNEPAAKAVAEFFAGCEAFETAFNEAME